jgi:MoaA/NifB/PqqE/SkfB family radical SAM enzyme
MAPATQTLKDPRRYFEAVEADGAIATHPPVCLYLEVTNRCNLLCEPARARSRNWSPRPT